MIVGVARMQFQLFDVRSLKQKRSIVKSMVRRLENAFNASVAEVDLNDSLTGAVIGVSMTGNDGRMINAKLDKAINMADSMGLARLHDHWIDIIQF